MNPVNRMNRQKGVKLENRFLVIEDEIQLALELKGYLAVDIFNKECIEDKEDDDYYDDDDVDDVDSCFDDYHEYYDDLD